ncbi:MAG: hypothetical protein WCW87_03050 [Candidatus Paceibacterota bacterium]
MSFGSFGLGRLSVLEEKKSPVRIEYNENTSSTASASNFIAGSSKKTTNSSVKAIGTNSEVVVASKNGKKYYLPWCSGVNRISEKNKIEFASKKEAENAGYTPASNCSGL